MTNGDNGIIIFNGNNNIPTTYRLKKRIMPLDVYDTEENRAKIEEMVHNSEFVDIQEDGKMIWVGRTDKNGYALINSKILPDRPDGDDGKTIRLHRLMQQMYNGGAPTNAYVCHRSDNPSNINPRDLFAGTAANNSICIILHNRRIYPKGQEHWSHKITDDQIVEMIHSYYANEMSITDLADKYGIHHDHAGKIINGHLRSYISQKAIKAAIAARQ